MTTKNAASTMEFRPIFTAGRAGFSIRLLMVVTIVVWVGAINLGYEILTNYGINPADGYDGKLAPLQVRIVLAAFLGLAGIGFAIPMIFLGHQVVSKVLLSDTNTHVRFRIMCLVGSRTLDVPRTGLLDVSRQEHSGESGTTVSRLRIRIRDRKWSLWIQLPGNVLDEKAFRQFIMRNKNRG